MKKSKIQELEQEILYHKEKYYSGHAEISDEAFDKLEENLRSLDPQNPVLQIVGSTPKEIETKVSHDKKMLSLEKTYSEDDLIKWIDNKDVVSIFKIDGSSCSLIYENHHLKVAKTRGDGSFGENITSKLIFMGNVPKNINKDSRIEIRGEVFCKENEFFELTNEMRRLNLELPSSQRNIVAGILGRKENIQLARFLNFKAFDIISNEKIKTESEKFDLLKNLGFDVPEFVLHKKNTGIKERIEEAKSFSSSGDYLIDGLVWVYNDVKMHEELGETSHHPRYKLAFKFAGESKKTKIVKIEWGVSRNGVLTPVAIVEPVELSGALISRVTLHNMGLVKSFNLKIDDEIEIIRSGEVIPKFLSVVKSSHQNIFIPNQCPSCHGPLLEDEIWLICRNENCPEKVKAEILNYFHRSGIEDISDKRIEEMLEKKLITKISDIYSLTKEDFFRLEKVKEKLAEKMFNNIQKSKNQNILNFIVSIGIEGLSKTKTEKIIDHGFNTLEKFLNLSEENLKNIEGFAEKSSRDIVKSLNSKNKLISDLLDAGVRIEELSKKKHSNKLELKKICITGELSRPRSEFEEIIKSHGGVITGSVSKNTDYLLTNETDSGSSKFLKAKSLGVEIISEQELISILGEI